MAKVFFNGSVDSANIAGMTLSDTQYQEKYPLANQNHYVIKTCSDDDYNNFLKGKKLVVINSDESITAGDLPDTSDIDNQTKEKFINARNQYLQELRYFKENFSSHSKISLIDDAIDFVDSIDVENLTYPHLYFQRYCINNDKYVFLNYL